MISRLLHWTFRPYAKYAVFSGRSPRREFFGYMTMCMLVIGVMSITTLAGFYVARMSGEITAFRLASGTLIGFYVLNIIPFFALMVRRFHDIGRSGWMTLLFLIPLVGGIIVFYFMGRPGLRGDNAYGPDLVPDSVVIPVRVSRLKERVVRRFGRSTIPAHQ